MIVTFISNYSFIYFNFTLGHKYDYKPQNPFICFVDFIKTFQIYEFHSKDSFTIHILKLG